VDFGAALNNTSPSAVQITTPVGVTYPDPSEVRILQDAGNYIVFVGNRTSSTHINRLNFGNSVTNTPTGEDITITGSDRPRSLSFVRDCDQWYGFVSSENNSKVFKLAFGTSLLNSPTQTDLTLSGDPLVRPFRIRMFNDNDNFYGIMSSIPGNLYRMDIGSDISVGTSVIEDLGTFGLLSSTAGYDMVRDSLDFMGFGIGSSNRDLTRTKFSTSCPVNEGISTELIPPFIEYSGDGTFNISLEVTDGNGHVDRVSHSVTVSTSIAPEADISIDANRCLGNPNSFSGVDLSGDIISWTWDFGDGTPTGSGQNVMHTYATADTFLVKLTVDNALGCSNIVLQELPIYEPTVADFTVPGGTLCSNSDIQFTNTSTGETGSVVQWLWDFNGEGNSTDKDPTFNFSTPGMKNITLTATLPGCSDFITTPINLTEGPVVDYSYTNNCFGEAIQFTNESTGTGITGYLWDFGDMSTSTNENPTHTYAIAGIYAVSLTVDNAAGCSTTFQDTVRVNDGDLADFTNGTLVENIPGQFMGIDLTFVGDSIISWSWDFGGLGTSTDQNPFFAFPSAGMYNVELSVVTAQGCSFMTDKDVQVDASICPTADFVAPATVCTGEHFEISNNSVNGTNYLWNFCPGRSLLPGWVFAQLMGRYWSAQFQNPP